MRFSLTACMLALLVACGAQTPGIEAETAYIVSPIGSRNVTLGGLEIKAIGEDIRLLSASSPMAERIEIHTSLTTETGRLQMRRLDDLTIEVDQTVTLGPGGVHLMVFGFAPELAPGDALDLTLHYQQGGDTRAQTVTARVTELGDGTGSHAAHGS